MLLKVYYIRNVSGYVNKDVTEKTALFMTSMIEQIAKELGVSSATVSRALNDRPGVSGELRERILAKARELDYTPGVTARGLATSQTFSVGFFIREKPGIPAQSDPFYSEILHGVEQVAARTDYHITIGTLTDIIIARPADFRFVREKRIDAMILAGPDIPADFIMAMLKTQTPVILVDNRLSQTHVNCVNSDDEDGAYQAVRHLLGLGHKRIGALAGPANWHSTVQRLNGYRRALDEARLPLHVQHADRTTIDSGQEAMARLLERQPEITAVCAVNDSMAIGAIRAARAAGKGVPEDLSVTGFDDIAWATLNEPPLTTVHIPKQQMGKEVILRLIALLNEPDLLPSEIKVPVQLIERRSTARASAL